MKVSASVAVPGVRRRRLPGRGLAIYGAVFVVALLLRYAAFVRGDFMAWWDGGTPFPAYADLWIGSASRLAFEGNTGALYFSLEGLLFTVVMAPFLKLLGLQGGLLAWSHFLVITSALVAPIAAFTLRAISGRIVGGVLAGAMVAFDPVLTWYGLNGWSDAAVMFGAAAAFLAFVLAAQRPSRPRLAFFGFTLVVLALDHATWTWPALAWAMMAIPLLAVRHRWLRTAEGPPAARRDLRSLLPLGVPLGTLVLSLIIVNGVLLGLGNTESGNPFPVLTSDSGNQRRMVEYYDPDLDWEAWRPFDTLRVVATRFPLALPQQIGKLVSEQVAPAIPLAGWLLLLMGGGLAVIAADGHARRSPSAWGLLGLLGIGLLAWRIPVALDATVGATLLVVALAWLLIPSARVLLLVSLPILGIVFLWTGTITRLRHSNTVVYLLYLLAGLVVDEAVGTGARARAWAGPRVEQIARTGAQVALVVGLLTAVAFGAIQLALALNGRAAEEEYLAWLAQAMPASAILMTTGDVDPWWVQRRIGRTVYYDVEHGGRMVLDGGEVAWGRNVSTFFPDATRNHEILDSIWQRGDEIWFYRPGPDRPPQTFTPRFVGEETYTEFEVVPIRTYPQDGRRAAYVVRPPGPGA